jgi:hypothetical protein
MLGNQCERPLLQVKLGAFLYPDLGLFRRAAKGGENGDVGIEPKAVIPPVPRSHHSSIQVENALQFSAVERRNGSPIPRMRKRRDDTQALFTLGSG